MFALSDNKPWTGAGMQGAKRVAATLLRPYAQVYFAKSPWVGFLFAAATFLAPLQGLSGLIGLIAADLIARWLGQPKDLIDRGFFGFNGLLVGLAIGLYYNLTVPMVGFLVLAVFFSVVVGAVLHYLTTRYIGVPVLSTPFVFAVWAALLATRRFSEAEFALEPILVTHWGAGLLPAGVELYLRSLGAAFFQLSVASGLLVFLGFVDLLPLGGAVVHVRVRRRVDRLQRHGRQRRRPVEPSPVWLISSCFAHRSRSINIVLSSVVVGIMARASPLYSRRRNAGAVRPYQLHRYSPCRSSSPPAHALRRRWCARARARWNAGQRVGNARVEPESRAYRHGTLSRPGGAGGVPAGQRAMDDFQTPTASTRTRALGPRGRTGCGR
ncbi:MAG: urea transporter [Deltaproteobacteria bacterium]|nr:urea transporter [Deltaproteobacteria bacterium]